LNNKLSPWWVTGITDSEGNFSINYNSKSKKINASYKVTQKDHSLIVLSDLKSFFNCGNINIDNRKFNTYKYTVTKTLDLVGIIIPHFDNYPLVGSKNLDFLDFKRALVLLIERNPNNLNKILLIKSKMNKKRLFEERWNYLNKLTFDLKPEWVQAFIDGEGTFQCRIADVSSKGKSYVSINPTLEIAQSSHDIEVLNAIKNFFGLGYLKPKYNIKSLDESKKSRSVNRLIINKCKNIIKFLDKYSMLTRKYLDYLDWKSIIELKSNNTHKTIKGLQDMINLKTGMNRGRLLNSNLLCNFDRLKVVNWSNLSVNKKSYHTKVDKNKKNTFPFSFILILFLGVIGFVLYLYDSNLLISCLEKSLFILFFFFLILFYLDEFKLSNNKWIKYSQIIIFILFIIYVICYIIPIYFLNYNLFNDVILKVNSDDIKDVIENKDITLKGKIVLDKEAGAEVAKGLSTLGSNVGLGACVGGIAAGVSKAVAKSPLPPIQKAGLIIGAGIAGAVIHAGANAINAQTHAERSNKSPNSTNQNILPKDSHEFISSLNDHTPLEILLQSIYILNSISIWLIIILLIQILFKLYISDKPKLKVIDYILPSYSENIKIYIYKLIKLNKNMNIFYIIFGIILLFICIISSLYFSLELYNNLNNYVEVYIEYRKK